jgi:hypothetical protein
LLVDVMWFDILCCDVKAFLCHPAACALFHRSACPVENTAVSKYLSLRLMQLRQIFGFHSGINNLHFLLLYDTTLLGNWLRTFREEVGISFTKGQNEKDDSDI